MKYNKIEGAGGKLKPTPSKKCVGKGGDDQEPPTHIK